VRPPRKVAEHFKETETKSLKRDNGNQPLPQSEECLGGEVKGRGGGGSLERKGANEPAEGRKTVTSKTLKRWGKEEEGEH